MRYEKFASNSTDGFLCGIGVSIPCFGEGYVGTARLLMLLDVVLRAQIGRATSTTTTGAVYLAMEGFGKVVRGKGVGVLGVGGFCFKGERADAVRSSAQDVMHVIRASLVIAALRSHTKVGLIVGKLLRHVGPAALRIVVLAMVVMRTTHPGAGSPIVMVADGDDMSWCVSLGRLPILKLDVPRFVPCRVGNVLDLVLCCATKDVVLVHGHENHAFTDTAGLVRYANVRLKRSGETYGCE